MTRFVVVSNCFTLTTFSDEILISNSTTLYRVRRKKLASLALQAPGQAFRKVLASTCPFHHSALSDLMMVCSFRTHSFIHSHYIFLNSSINHAFLYRLCRCRSCDLQRRSCNVIPNGQRVSHFPCSSIVILSICYY